MAPHVEQHHTFRCSVAIRDIQPQAYRGSRRVQSARRVAHCAHFVQRGCRLDFGVSLALYDALERRFAGARSALVGDIMHTDIPLEGAWYRARLTMQPIASVVVALPCTDGFELPLRWNDRWINGDGAPRAASFDDSFLVETNDVALAGVWLDHDVRSGLLGSRYVSYHRAERKTALLLRDGRWVHQVSNDEVSARRPDRELSAYRMADMLAASLLLASRPVRWARAYTPVATALGGRSAARIE